MLKELSSSSLVTGGQVSRADPESTGLNPAWRDSLVYATLGTGWEDGATETEIQAARQLLIQDMRILEGLAPDSGAYLNEVIFLSSIAAMLPASDSISLFFACRPPDTSSTGRNLSSALITINFYPSNRSTIPTPSSLFTKASDRTGGMPISSAESETVLKYDITSWHC